VTISPVAVKSDAEPRVCRYPRYAYSSGPDAVDLAAMAGLHLDPWQQLVLEHALGERPDGKWAAFEVAVIVARQNGKGSILEALELAGLFLFGERLILHSAHEYRTAMEAFRRVRDLIDGCRDLRRKVAKVINTNGEEGIELRTGQRLKFTARSKAAGRGFSADRLIWDEAFALTEDQVDAQMPTLSARPNPQIIYTSSPPLDAVSGAQLFRVRRRALAGDPVLAYFDWGPDASLDDLSGVDLDDRELWRGTNPSMTSGRNTGITEETIERERAAMSDAGFARERLSVWPPDLSAGFGVIPEQDWRDALDEQSRIVGPPAFAAAVSLDRRTAAIATCGRRADGLLHVEVTSQSTPHGVELDNRPGTGWVVPRLKELADRHKPVAVVMDEFGPTGSLIAPAEEAGLEVTRIKTGDVGRAFGMFYDGISGTDLGGRNVRHIGQPELTSAVAGAVTRMIGDAKAWDRRTPAVDITPLVAATNALWGYVTRGQGAKAAFNPGVFTL
jgi:hypothetical protein